MFFFPSYVPPGEPVKEEKTLKEHKPQRASCLGCGVVMVQELDAYYGKDPDGLEFCSGCRYRRKIW